MTILELLDKYGFDTEPLGSYFRISCPFHDEQTPSCIIYPDTNSFHCFGCHTGGGIIEFISLQENITKAQVKERLSSIGDLRHRLSALDRKTEPDYTKETLLLMSKVVYNSVHGNPNRLPSVLKALAPFDEQIATQKFNFSSGIKFVAAVKKALGEAQ